MKIVLPATTLIAQVVIGTYYALFNIAITKSGYCHRTDAGLYIDTIIVHFCGTALIYQMVMSIDENTRKNQKSKLI